MPPQTPEPGTRTPLLALLLLAGCAGATKSEPPRRDPAPQAPREFTFVLSGDTAGFIVPCGCASKQFGGLPRRGSYLQAARREGEILYFDAGGSVHRATEYDALKLEYIWKGVLALRPAALNLGAGEVELGLERLRALAAAGLPLISANLRAEGEVPWRDHLVLEAGGARLAVTGICRPDAKLGPGLRLVEPEMALRALVPKLAKDADAVILLAYADEPRCLALIDAFPELAAVLAAGTPQPIPPRRVQDRAVLAAATSKGKFLARATLAASGLAWDLGAGEVVELSETYADEAAQAENLRAYQARLRAEKLDPARTGEAPALLRGLPEGYRYAGNAACARCHVADDALHRQMAHAHGLETLEKKGFEFDPYCLKCHTTGYGAPGGFSTLDRTPALGGIGCESCHGPSQAHAANPRLKTPVKGSAACITCHDPDNSPSFDYAVYWPKIVHGLEKAVEPPGGAAP
ncbi:MAG: multiheme c-type cytochrome [Planctomycetota bacterium]|nr:multiheme c-type cytochrome [Planctomycetota bacterium]